MDRSRTPLVAGNWKMHCGGAAGLDLGIQVARAAARLSSVDVVVAPPLTVLVALVRETREVARQLACQPVGIAAQNLHPASEGAFTGEVSAPMLAEAGCDWVIVGHSERRQYFAEQDDFVADKVRAALGAGLHPIVCIGETLAERSAGETLAIVLGMLDAVADCIADAGGRAAIAYEPVWAIGTGKVATPGDAQQVHAAIRERLASRDPELARVTRIIYGGSVKADNVRSLLTQPDVDGALVGGASLAVSSFGPIMTTAEELSRCRKP